MFRLLSILLPGLLCSFCCVAQHCYVFVGSYNKDKTKEGIYVFEMDTVSGALTKVSAVDSVLNPAYLTLSPDGKYIYACTEAKTPGAGSVSSFSFNQQLKTLTFVNSQKSGGENPIYVSLDNSGKWLINANYTEASVSAYPVTTEGIIKESREFIRFEGSSINKDRQEKAHTHSAVFSPKGDYVFIPDLGSDKIWCYRFDSLAGGPLKYAESPFITTAPGSGPRHLVFHPNGKYAYCTEELSGTVTTYSYANGILTRMQRINAHPDSLKSGFSGSDLHLSPGGKFLYSSNRGFENNIAIFAIKRNGKLKLKGYHTSGGNHPRIFALSPTGKFVVVANQVTGNVVVFKRNPITGLLEDTGIEVQVEGASCVKIRQY
jgi:6-phosphogluconolactonase (cycloisomerase 2 family)